MAYYGCTSLSAVLIPDSVESIGTFNTFYGHTVIYCNENSYANKYAIENGYKVKDPDQFLTADKQGTEENKDFAISDGLLTKYTGAAGEVTIPEGVTVIGCEAFRDCKKLKKVIIPEGVECIEYGAFWECTGLTSVSLPDSLTTLYSRAFLNCSFIKMLFQPNHIL
jgi:hypothetical protein